MRLIVDSLIALMLVAILATVVLHYRQEHRQLQQIRYVHQSLASLHEQVVYHRAMAQVHEAQVQHRRTLNEASGFPVHISPTWFDDKLPMNVFASLRQPWMDLAPPGDRHDHPPDPVIETREQAGFWYNPQRGIVRARVPAQFSDQRTLELYNRVNGTTLLALPESDDPDREPQPHSLAPDPEHRHMPEVFEDTQLDQHIDRISFALPTMLSLKSPEPADAEPMPTALDNGDQPDAEQAEGGQAHDGADEAAQAAARRTDRPTLADRPRPARDQSPAVE